MHARDQSSAELVRAPDRRADVRAAPLSPALLLRVGFLGGMWSGIAALGGVDTPRWIWPAAVAPTLIALPSAVPWAIGASWPRPSLELPGLLLVASLAVDAQLKSIGLCPAWWMALRAPLSIGLGGLTLITALL